ncbi:hypothetical protein WG31_03530 [Acetobacter oryzifermentans]|uniref:Uncharacterized protein n=1 Tax=Acetobacter oryzifermentans TaxID=1633874 RepID=A0ABN4NMR5_9PROT|nr:hypothetical protein WG31_03530 [Acetobacter oryzifermentans]
MAYDRAAKAWEEAFLNEWNNNGWAGANQQDQPGLSYLCLLRMAGKGNIFFVTHTANIAPHGRAA